jgi:hypothetical protein
MNACRPTGNSVKLSSVSNPVVARVDTRYLQGRVRAASTTHNGDTRAGKRLDGRDYRRPAGIPSIG